jgi:hypothetical protein
MVCQVANLIAVMQETKLEAEALYDLALEAKLSLLSYSVVHIV